MGGEHIHRPRQALQRANVHLVLRNAAAPVLDGADRGHRLAYLQQRFARIALAGCERILEHDDRQVARVRDALEMRERHLGRLLQGERRRREHQQGGCAALRRHAGDARRFETPIGPHAVDDRQLAADLVLRDLEHAALLLECAGGNLGRMRVQRDRGDALGRSDIAQMPAEALLVDRQIVMERQQHRRDDAVRNEGGITGHEGLRYCSQVCARRSAFHHPGSAAPADDALRYSSGGDRSPIRDLYAKPGPRLLSNSALAAAISSGLFEICATVSASVLAATTAPLSPMLMPPAAVACQLWAAVPGTHVAVRREASGVTQLTSPESVEAYFWPLNR